MDTDADIESLVHLKSLDMCKFCNYALDSCYCLLFFLLTVYILNMCSSKCLAENSFTGDIPSEYCMLSSLESLNLGKISQINVFDIIGF